MIESITAARDVIEVLDNRPKVLLDNRANSGFKTF